jgi:two-component system phosphate regulon sensor histidine kinase PhoR
MKIKKTYSYALWSAIYITLLSSVFAAIWYFFILKQLSASAILIFILVLFVSSFFIIQYRAEHFIYRRLKKIYEDVSILDVNDLRKDSVTTDIEQLSNKMQTYAEGKELEIKSLTDRDSFRRDFLGNVAH